MANTTKAPARQGRTPLSLSDRQLLLVLGDLAVISLALGIALETRLLGLRRVIVASSELQVLWWIVLALLWLVLANIAKLYDLSLAALPAKSAATAGIVACVVCTIYLVIPVWSAPLTKSRLSWFVFVILATLGEAAWRGAYGKLLHTGRYCRNVVIVGLGEEAQQLAAVMTTKEFGACTKLLGVVSDTDPTEGLDEPTLGKVTSLVHLIDDMGIDDIVVALGPGYALSPEIRDTLVECWERGAQVYPVSEYFERVMAYVPVRLIGPNVFALGSSSAGLYRTLYQAARRLVDIGASAIGCVAFGLALPFLAAAIWVDCPGPIFYRQQRVGVGGREFTITKLRSMVPDAEVAGRAVWARKNDSRITRVGRILRKTRLDELPQLWSVLKGDMSLIGPRPERPEFVNELKVTLPYYAVRHAIRPGLTGWAQVRYRYGSSEEDALIKLQYDLYYIKHHGPMLDAVIVLHTLRTIVRMEGT